MPYSTCCGAHTNFTEYDICPDCLDHCDWENDFEEGIEEEQLELDKQAENQIEQNKLNAL